MSDVVIQSGVNPNKYGNTHSENIDFLYDALHDNLYRIRLLLRYDENSWDGSGKKTVRTTELSVDYDTLREGVSSYVDTLKGSGETTLAITQEGVDDALFLVDVKPLHGEQMPDAVDDEVLIPISMLMDFDEVVGTDVDTALELAQQKIEEAADRPVESDVSNLSTIQSITGRLIKHAVDNRTHRPLEEVPTEDDPAFIGNEGVQKVLQDVRTFVNNKNGEIEDIDEQQLLDDYIDILALHDDDALRDEINETLRWMARQQTVIDTHSAVMSLVHYLDEEREKIDDSTVASLAQHHRDNVTNPYPDMHKKYLKRLATKKNN